MTRKCFLVSDRRNIIQRMRTMTRTLISMLTAIYAVSLNWIRKSLKRKIAKELARTLQTQSAKRGRMIKAGDAVARRRCIAPQRVNISLCFRGFANAKSAPVVRTKRLENIATGHAESGGDSSTSGYPSVSSRNHSWPFYACISNQFGHFRRS